MKSIKKIGLLIVTGTLALAAFGCSSTPPAGGSGTPAATASAAPTSAATP
ncbi:MAG: hypothetical protein U0931_00345 [Vulcanimicrobiota bacterium]